MAPDRQSHADVAHREVVVRRATQGDVYDIAELLRRAGLPRSVGGFRNEIARLRRRDPELLLIALRGGTLAGAIAGSYDGRTATVSRLAVDHEHRRHGVGTRLVEALCRQLATLGARSDMLIVLDQGEGSEEFWSAVGFSPERSVPFYIRQVG